MGSNLGNVKEKWRGVKASKGFHSALVFLAFIAVATVFWFIMALNDSVTRTFDVRLRIVNVPDSVTFITDPPTDIHVTLRDKGTNILRSGIVKHPQIDINFRDFASNTVFRFSKSDLNSALKSAFGTAAQIGSVSIDSLYLRYTTGKGKRVPIVVRANVTPAPGYVIAGIPEPRDRFVTVYSLSSNLDTITRVYTEPIIKRNLSESTEYKVSFDPLKDARLVPSEITVNIPVEPLVKKETTAQVKALNVPPGMSLLLFPNRVPVSYYVPMGLFSDDDVPVMVTVDFEDTRLTDVDRLPLTISPTEDYVMNPELLLDSVEYTLVKE